jgi:hypothetical protein
MKDCPHCGLSFAGEAHGCPESRPKPRLIDRLREDHVDTIECEHGFMLHRDPCPNVVCLARDLAEAADLLETAQTADDQWPPAHGIPAADRYRKPDSLEWGETPFDDLDRGELLRLVQAYHAAAVSAQGILHQFRWQRETQPFWAADGSGGQAWRRLDYLISRAGDGGLNAGSEKVYRAFFRSAYGLLFSEIDEEQWGIDDGDGTMLAPFKPGDANRLSGRPMRAFTWSDLLPKQGALL